MKAQEDLYGPVIGFIRSEIQSGRMEFNSVDRLEGTVARVVRAFERNGWRSVPVAGKPLHRKIYDPQGREVLKQIGGEPFRHSQVTVDLCANKPLVKKIFDMKGIPVASGADFARTERAEAEVFYRLANKPLVVKPSHDGGSHGVSVGLFEDSEFGAAWLKAAAAPVERNRIQIEEFVRGVEVRCYVVGNKVVAALARLQPFVIGDGRRTIVQLIDDLNESRLVNARLAKIKVLGDWTFLSKFGYGPDDVVPKDRIVLISPSTVFAAGGLMGDITDVLCDEIKELALRMKDAIPSLEITGLDMLVGDIGDVNSATAIEINTSAAVEPHIYPAWGESRDLAAVVADYFHQDYLTASSGFSQDQMGHEDG